MKGQSIAVAVLAFGVGCHAFPTPNTHELHEKRSSLPRFWERGGRVEGDSILPIRIGLAQSNLDKAYQYLMDVSHPTSPNFGKHWTAEEAHAAFAPEDDSVQLVRDWLLSSGVRSDEITHSDNKGWFALNIPTWKAEELFQTEYHEHIHTDTGAVKVGCDEYSLPGHIREHIDYITPGVKFSATLKRSVVQRSGRPFHKPGPYKYTPHPSGPWFPPPGANLLPPDLQDCGRNITPTCLKALYHIPNAYFKDNVNMLGLFEQGDAYAQDDLNKFFAQYATNVPQGTHPKLDSIDGGEAPVAPGSDMNSGESDIDIDIAYSLIYPQTVTLYQVDDSVQASTDGGFNTFLDALDGSYCNYTAYDITGDSPGVDSVYPDTAPGGYKGALQCGVYKPTRVISISYGVAEIDAPLNYTRRQCNEFLKFGLQGITVIYASGDYGVASFPGDDSDNGCLGPKSTVYNPSFPTCPYVLDVGATRLYDDQTVLDKESALQANLTGAPLFASAGGFANYFPVPDYQKAAVSTYFKNHDPGLPYYTINSDASNIGANGGLYNRAGRGFPDVSANGAQFRAYTNGTDHHYYGTSLSAPIWGSIVTLINEERTAIGKGPVGFMNPTLYGNTWVFNDIVNGSNPGCGSKGFEAVEGWDPVTGLGTPDFVKLTALYLGLP